MRIFRGRDAKALHEVERGTGGREGGACKEVDSNGAGYK